MIKLTPRERVQRALNHQEPDRVPVDLGTSVATSLTLGAFEKLKDYMGYQDAKGIVNYRMFQTVTVDEKILKALEVDLRPVYFRGAKNAPEKKVGEDIYENEWGVKIRRPKGGLYYDIIHFPLQNMEIEDLEKYPWPDPHDPSRVEGVEDEARDLFENSDYAIMGPGMGGSIFEHSWYLRGLEEFFTDLIVNKSFAHKLMRIITDFRKASYGAYLEKAGKYLDVVYYGDDIAMQTGPMISPKTYREMIKPYQKELFAFIKERTDAKIFYHTCGNVTELLDDLIEIGLDIINPVQVSAIDIGTKKLKEKFGDKLVFWGGIDTQRVLPFGTESDVESEVKQRIKDLAPGGGYVLTSVHNIQPDVPPQNIVQMFKTAKKVGTYPINI